MFFTICVPTRPNRIGTQSTTLPQFPELCRTGIDCNETEVFQSHYLLFLSFTVIINLFQKKKIALNI